MKKNSGFTLIELLVTMAVAAILAMVAVPAFQHFIQTNRLASRANAVISGIVYTRSEAIKQQKTISVCSSSNPKTNSTPSCSGSTNWSYGWLAFVDSGSGTASNDGNGTYDTGETLLKVLDNTAGDGVSLTGSVSHFIFKSSGLRGSTNPETVTATYTDCSTDGKRTITVNATGGVTTTKSDC